MYSIKHIKITLAILLAATLANSCGKDEVAAVYEGDSGFAFASSVLYAEVSSADAGILEIPVYRGEQGEAEQVHIDFFFDVSDSETAEPEWEKEDPEGHFSLLSPNVTFAENSCEALIRIKFGDSDKLLSSSRYRMKLDINDGASPSQRNSVMVTVTKKLEFEKYGDCTYFDECIFEKAYTTEIYKAKGEEIYRVMDPYREGLIAEEYASTGWLGETPDYVEFRCDDDDHISFKRFQTGMLFNKTHMTYAYYPSDYIWGRDFSKYDAKNVKIDDKHFQLYAVYCLPSFQYGYLNDGIYMIDIIVK